MKKLIFAQEVVWWLVSVVLAWAVVYPITSQADFNYAFPNFLIVVLSFNYLRYIITFTKLWFLKPKPVRIGWFLLNMYVFIFILNRLEVALVAVDSYAVYEIFSNHSLNPNNERNLLKYFESQYVLFSVASFLGIAGYNFRLLASFWSKSKVKKEQIITVK
jgi:hypothetical protein